MNQQLLRRVFCFSFLFIGFFLWCLSVCVVAYYFELILKSLSCLLAIPVELVAVFQLVLPAFNVFLSVYSNVLCLLKQ